MSDNDARYRRNPYLLLQWEERGPVIVVSSTLRRFAAPEALVRLISKAHEPTTVQTIAEELGISTLQEAEAVTKALVVAEVLIDTAAKGNGASRPDRLHPRWTAFELATHQQAARGPQSFEKGVAAPDARYRPYGGSRTPLPARDLPSSSLSDVLRDRRSIRSYSDAPLNLDALGCFLARAARVKRVIGDPAAQTTHRPSPSAGARHGVELYLLCRDVVDLVSGVFYYDPFAHELVHIADWSDEISEIQKRTVVTPGRMKGPPQLSIYLVGIPDRVLWKYAGMALSAIYRDTGCLLQTMYLVGTDLGLATCAIAAMDASPPQIFFAEDDRDLLHVGSFALGVAATGA